MDTPMIINKSATRKAWVRYLEVGLSALMWLLYLYLIRTALFDLNLLASGVFHWAFSGAGTPHLPVVARVLGTLRDYSFVIVANSVIFIVWARYNQYRFRGMDRRNGEDQVSVADLSVLYAFPVEDIALWQQSRHLVMHHAPDGTLIKVGVRDQETTADDLRQKRRPRSSR